MSRSFQSYAAVPCPQHRLRTANITANFTTHFIHEQFHTLACAPQTLLHILLHTFFHTHISHSYPPAHRTLYYSQFPTSCTRYRSAAHGTFARMQGTYACTHARTHARTHASRHARTHIRTHARTLAGSLARMHARTNRPKQQYM